MPNTPIIVAADQDRRTGLVKELSRYGITSLTGNIPVDVVWSAHTQAIMGDLKKPADLISSVTDGRLHEQTQAMKDANALGFLLIEGQWSKDGITVGSREHSWTWEAFCDLLMSIQLEGIKVDFSYSPETTARRLASLYKWTEKEKRGSWHVPVSLLPPAKNYLDKAYRKQIGMVMSLPDCGAIRADTLISTFGLMPTLGITEEGLVEAIARWKTIRGVGPKLPKQWEEFLRG